MKYDVTLPADPSVQDVLDALQKVPNKKMKLLVEHADHTDFTYKLPPTEVYIGNPVDSSGEGDASDEVLLIKFTFGE